MRGCSEEGNHSIAASFSGIQTARMEQTEVKARESLAGKSLWSEILISTHLVLVTPCAKLTPRAGQGGDWGVFMSRETDLPPKKINLSL